MEKRIKTLYIITIAAILAFLGMQVYWLYGRYEASLNDQEDRILTLIKGAMDDYFNSYYDLRHNFNYITSYSTSKQYDASHQKNIKAEIVWYDRSKIADYPVKDSTKTDEENIKEAKRVLDSQASNIKKSYDVSNSPSEGDVWTAMHKADLEFEYTMTARRMDSIIASIGVDGKSRLVTLDSMVWNYSMSRHSSSLNPTAVVRIPYSELDRKIAEVEFLIPAGVVLKDMGVTLAAVGVLSVFLIMCLVFQINTVLKLSRLDRMRNSFITTMIHELKRPISTLKMCVSGLVNERMMEDLATRNEMLGESRKALDNLSAYFSKLRDITFNNVEQIPLNLQLVSLHRLLNDVELSLTVPSDKDVKVINEIDENLEVSADSAHLFNIMSNLAENAVKYSGSSVEIKVSASSCEGYVEIRISDTGNGIPAADLKHIFKRFYRGKAAGGDQPGMGLGLAYVKLLVEAHGGEIEVESEEGRGTCFTIILPQ